MSTIHNVHGDMVAGSAALQPADEVPIWEAATGLSKKLTGTLLMGGNAAPVAVTAGATTLAVTQASHGNRTIVLNNTAPIAITLPQATGSGAKYRFQFQVAATGTASTIKVANGTDVMQGFVMALTTSSNNVIGWKTSATSDTASFNGGTQGGVAGDWFEVEDVKTGFFRVHGQTAPATSEATPFSASVS